MTSASEASSSSRGASSAVADRQLGQAGDADRPGLGVDDQEVEQFARLALGGQAGDVGLGLLARLVRAPREPLGDLRIAGQLEQRLGVVWHEVAQPEGGAADDHAREATDEACFRTA